MWRASGRDHRARRTGPGDSMSSESAFFCSWRGDIIFGVAVVSRARARGRGMVGDPFAVRVRNGSVPRRSAFREWLRLADAPLALPRGRTLRAPVRSGPSRPAADVLLCGRASRRVAHDLSETTVERAERGRACEGSDASLHRAWPYG